MILLPLIVILYKIWITFLFSTSNSISNSIFSHYFYHSYFVYILNLSISLCSTIHFVFQHVRARTFDKENKMICRVNMRYKRVQESQYSGLKKLACDTSVEPKKNKNKLFETKKRKKIKMMKP